ncbi:MAG: DUF167 domain-containing protein [Acidobacteriota bacterium]
MSVPAPAGPFHAGPSGTRIDVRVIPRSSKDLVAGLRDSRLLVRVTAPPVDHAANDAVVRVLADALDVSKSAVSVVAGHTTRNKVIQVVGLTPGAARQRLLR